MVLKERKAVWLTCCILFALNVINCFFSVTGYGMGLGVDPAEINLRNVPLGELVAVSVLGGKGMMLTIENKSSSAYNYSINILHSSQTSAPLKQGYADIPDTAWIRPKNKEVKVAGKSKKTVEIFLKIPGKEEYYNKKYQAVIEVKSKKNDIREIFVLACQLKLCFTTISREKEE
ncbi:MAG: hypothetical protein KAT96_02040 [Candidatus Omnitrophica bacterium]|nr:hypothetical protein [Candidatus Omnitrophota bacterium]